jgi:signal transduction histidine kinase
MRSLSVRMMLAALGTLLVSFVAFGTVFLMVSGPQIETGFRRFHAVQLEDAVTTLNEGGTPAVSTYLDQLSRRLDCTFYLTDANGRDVVSGVDRSALLGRGSFGRLLQMDNRTVMVESSADGRFRLVTLVPLPFTLLDFLPYYFVVAAAIVLLWWLFAIGIASPIGQLTAAVGRFGGGDLGARARIARRDEVGDLARAFDDMAERIQTLMTAERRLLQDISHELRSPLTRLSIGVELLRTTTNREHAIGRLQIEVERLTMLVGSLLEVTRNEGDPWSRRSGPMEVAAIVREVVESSTLEADRRACCIVVGGDTTRTVLGDPELIRRAVDNVVRNAIRYAPPNTRIDVGIAERLADTVITVRDVGPGVPEGLLPRLADPFFRVDAARDANTGGVGLGLSIARRALHVHHGDLVAENANPGLRITLTIPYDDAAGIE